LFIFVGLAVIIITIALIAGSSFAKDRAKKVAEQNNKLLKNILQSTKAPRQNNFHFLLFRG